MMVELEPVKQKMRKARVRTAEQAEAEGVITGNEAAAMREALALVREVSIGRRFCRRRNHRQTGAQSANGKAKKAA